MPTPVEPTTIHDKSRTVTLVIDDSGESPSDSRAAIRRAVYAALALGWVLGFIAGKL